MVMEFIFIFHDNIWYVLLLYCLHLWVTLYAIHNVLSNVNNDPVQSWSCSASSVFHSGTALFMSLNVIYRVFILFSSFSFAFWFLPACSFIYLITGIIIITRQILQRGQARYFLVFLIYHLQYCIFMCVCCLYNVYWCVYVLYEDAQRLEDDFRSSVPLISTSFSLNKASHRT